MSCFSPASFTLVPLGKLILPIISYLSRGCYFLHLSSFPCFTARLPFSQNALGGLCCRWFSLLPLCCCQGMQIQPAQNLGRSDLSGQGSVQPCEAAHINQQQTYGASQLHPDTGQMREGGMDNVVEISGANRGAQKTLKVLLEQGQLQQSQKKLQTAHMAHKPGTDKSQVPQYPIKRS